MTATNDRPALTFADAVAAIDGKGPNKRGWYNGLCPVPAHDDSTPSLGIMDKGDGAFVIKCMAGCKPGQVITALEQKTGKRYRAKNNGERAEPSGLTLARYAEIKKLPALFLQFFFRVIEGSYYGTDGVGFPYYDENGDFVGLKARLSESSHDARWTGNSGPGLYGLATLKILERINGWDLNRIVLCEGESDTQTLVFNGVPALGVSGKNNWKQEFANLPILKNAKEIFVIQEPDAEEFVDQVIASFPEGKAHRLVLPAKDPSELWLSSASSEDFVAAWLKAIEGGYDRSIAFTDTGNAERLVKMHGQNFRWLTDVSTFHVWNGTCWRADTTGKVLLPHTKDVVRAIADSDWRVESESAGKRNAMIDLSRGEKAVLAESSWFDRYPMLLNVQNGTLDLETGELRDFRRDDFLTKCANVYFDLFADCPKFDEFLNFIFDGDKETIHFMLKALGYTLTGDIGESCFFICYGLGANGKTTLVETLMQILGADLATPAKFSTFVAQKGIDAKYELAQFKGKRLVTAVEPRKAGHLDEEVLKQMTGGDMVRARDIYQKDIVYYPEFKLWLAMNNRPRILGTDDGIWRRVRMIPFNVRIPESRKVKEFNKVLYAEEGPGILNRLLEGARAWREEGLKMSGAIARATNEFRASQNIIQGFFDTCTVSGQPGIHARAGELYARYKEWAQEQGEPVLRQNEFADELASRRFERRTKQGGAVEWWGIGLKADAVGAGRA